MVKRRTNHWLIWCGVGLVAVGVGAGAAQSEEGPRSKMDWPQFRGNSHLTGVSASRLPEKLELLMKGIGLLLRAVALKYKLSPEAEENLSSSIAGVLREGGGLLVPEQVSEH